MPNFLDVFYRLIAQPKCISSYFIEVISGYRNVSIQNMILLYCLFFVRNVESCTAAAHQQKAEFELPFAKKSSFLKVMMPFCHNICQFHRCAKSALCGSMIEYNVFVVC